MSLFHLGIEDISLKDIENLVQEGVVESKTLEYKREFNLDTNNSKVEFLNDLTAMANASGGDILFGVEDCEGKPKITGLPIDNIDALKLKIESILRDSVSPRLKYEIKPIEIIADTYIIIIRIYESLSAPHMVKSGGCGFYKRTQSGKHKMSVDELRECFMTSAGYSKEAYLFHLKDEFEYNKEVMDSLFKYIVDNPPTVSAFEAVNAGTFHFRLEAWNAIVRAGILPLLTYEQQKSFQEADKSIRDTARLIQMVNADWKRNVEFNKWDTIHNSRQLASLHEVFNSKKSYLKTIITEGIRSIGAALKTFEQ